MNRPSSADSYKSSTNAVVNMQSTIVAALETRMEMLVAIELIIGAIFVVRFWYKNPELILSRCSRHGMPELYDDE